MSTTVKSAAPAKVTVKVTPEQVADLQKRVDETFGGAEPAKFVPKLLKLVTVPLLKLRPGMTVYVKILDKMEKAAPLKNQAAGENKEPPTLVKVTNLETGEVCQIILGTVLRDIFGDHYPNDGYVGKGFQIVVNEQKAAQGGGGKRYNNYSVSEIEV